MLAAALALAGCGRDEPAAAPAGGAAPPPPQVGVVTVTEQAVPLEAELPGRVEPLRVAQVRARVTGIVQQRLFTEGSVVRAGQPLFRIDPAPYRAAHQSAVAQLARAQANVGVAAAQARRFAPLVEANAISKQEYDNAVASQAQAEADVAAARAAVTTARLNLDYTTVTAPIGGRIGRALVSEGALVTQAEGTQLATIQQTDRVYVNFTQSAAEVLRLRRALAAERLQRSAAGAVPVRVVLDDGTELDRSGTLLFTDLTVDATSGQVTLRAEVPNPDGLLLPGQYVRVRLAQAQLPSAMLLPQQAVQRSDQGDTVLVVGDGGGVETRRVEVARAAGGRWVVTAGLKPGERVVVDGVQKLQMLPPGTPVQPVPWTEATASAPTGSAASTPAAAGAAPPVAPPRAAAVAPASAAAR